MGATQRVGDIVWVTPPPHATDEGIEAVLAELREHLRRGDPYALVFDMSNAGVPSALQRKRLVAHMADQAPNIRRVVRGLGVIAPSPVLRGAITALFWLAPPLVPHRLFETRSEAIDWAEALA
jgi:hypothetical protein